MRPSPRRSTSSARFEFRPEHLLQGRSSLRRIPRPVPFPPPPHPFRRTMLDNALTTQLKTYLEMVREPIVLVPSPYRGDDAAKSSKSAHMDELLSEIAALSDQV
ncbi:MAG: alkyl hydroperoxide reductase subunit F, partial [Cutibacterium acnes]